MENFQMDHIKKALEELIGFDLIYELDNSTDFINIQMEVKSPFFTVLNDPSVHASFFTIASKYLNSARKKETWLPSYTTAFIENICQQYLSFVFYNNKDNDYSYEQYLFFETLKSVSNKTYEGIPANLGLLLFPNQEIEEIKHIINSLELDFIQLNSNEKLDFYIKNKQTYKIIDGYSLAFIVNGNFEILGITRKKVNGKSIKDLVLNRLHDLSIHHHNLYIASLYKQTAIKAPGLEASIRNKVIKTCNDELKQIVSKMNFPDYFFIEVRSGNINVHLLEDVFFSIVNNKWKLKYFQFMKFLLTNNNGLSRRIFGEKFFYASDSSFPTSIVNDKCKHLVESVNKFISIVRYASENNIGSLFLILAVNEFEVNKYITKDYIDIPLPDELLLHYKKTNNQLAVVLNMNDCKLNLKSCDKYLFVLLSSVDGSVILDSNFNILSFGELINSSGEVSPSEQGARTAAALAASKFGTAIKVSEDGNISVYHSQKKLMEI
ncbi:hypothetical protein H1S01_15425 [Heliobacterium chlorum]|uniref:DAC domain-containing protein n=1 Tax=Heliobacterium chlorum TaxID=2698 RepID=A0ABR7T835_HELCL|nr:diadenylate cyclase [Heliobacterium chlorum]MBC9785876.1 hypothetical protein [Heliobacterium chlorum]